MSISSHHTYSHAALQVSFGHNSVGQLEYTAGLDTAAIAGGVSGASATTTFSGKYTSG